MSKYDLSISIVGTDRASGIFNNLAWSFSRVGQIFGGIVASRIFYMIADGISTVFENCFNATAQFQLMQTTLQGLVARELVELSNGMKTVADVFPQATVHAAKLMDELAKMAILSPYTVELVQNVFRMNMAFGFSVEQSKKLTDALLNYAAAIGASNDMLDRMAYNLAQIRRQGKVTALDIRQLALAGFDLNRVLQYVGQQMGINIKTHLDFNAAILAGKITWSDFVKYFQKYADENFAGASERLAKTLIGLKSTFHDVWILSIPKMVLPAIDAITARISRLLDFVIMLRDSKALDEIGAKWGAAVEKWIAPIDKVIDFLMTYARLVVAMGKQDINIHAWNELKIEIKELLGSMDLLHNVVLMLFGPGSIKVLDKFIATWKKLQPGIKFVKDAFNDLKYWFLILLKAFKDFWTIYGPSVSNSFKIIGDALIGLGSDTVTGGIGLIGKIVSAFYLFLTGEGGRKIAEYFDKFARFIAGTLVPAIRTLVTWLGTNIPIAYKAVSDFWQLHLRIALLDFWDVITKKLVPKIVEWYTWLAVHVPLAFAKVQEIWNTKLKPALEKLYTFIDEKVIPAFERLRDFIRDKLIPWFQVHIPIAMQAVKDAYNNHIKPAFDKICTFIGEELIPALKKLYNWCKIHIPEAWATLKTKWEQDLKPALEQLKLRLVGEDGKSGVVGAVILLVKHLEPSPGLLTGAALSAAALAGALRLILAVAPGVGSVLGTLLGAVGPPLASAITTAAIALAGTVGIGGAAAVPSLASAFVTTFGGITAFSGATTTTTAGLGLLGGAAGTTAVAFGGLGTVLGPVLIVLGGIAIVVAEIALGVLLLTIAWITNFAGFRDFTIEAAKKLKEPLDRIKGALSPILGFVASLGEDAVPKLTEAWDGLTAAGWLLWDPLLKIEGILVDMYMGYWDIILVIGQHLQPTFGAITRFINESFLPALRDVWEILDLIAKLARTAFKVAVDIAKLAVQWWADQWDRIVKALTGKEGVKELMIAIKDYLVDTFSGTINWFVTTVLTPLATVFETIRKALADIKQLIADAIAALEDFDERLPKLFRGDSPSPLEKSFRGIANAIEVASDAYNGFGASSFGGPGNLRGPTSVVVNVQIDKMATEMDVEQTFQKIATRLRYEMMISK